MGYKHRNYEGQGEYIEKEYQGKNLYFEKEGVINWDYNIFAENRSYEQMYQIMLALE